MSKLPHTQARTTGLLKLLVFSSIVYSFPNSDSHAGLFSRTTSDSKCESYLSRPNILDDSAVPGKADPTLPKPWNRLKPAHLDAIAEILEMYPTEEIYFLAR